MLNCVIICEETDIKATLEAYVNKIPGLFLLGCFNQVEEASTILSNERIDLVFIHSLSLNTELSTYLNRSISRPLCIAITRDLTFRVDPNQFDLFDLSLNPVDFARFLTTYGPKKGFLIFRDKQQAVIVRHNDIHYVAGDKDYVRVVTNGKTHLVHKTLAQLEEELPKSRFIRVQKSYIINLDFAVSVSADKVIMKDGIPSIPVGRQYRDNLYRQLGLG